LFKCILEATFCEDVQHRVRFSLGHLDRFKTAAFLCVWLKLTSPNTYLITARFMKFAKHLRLFLWWIHLEIESSQIHKLREILNADSQGMPVLPLHGAITTAVQMAATLPEIMDTPS
jgi:hypothetical protein